MHSLCSPPSPVGTLPSLSPLSHRTTTDRASASSATMVPNPWTPHRQHRAAHLHARVCVQTLTLGRASQALMLGRVLRCKHTDAALPQRATAGDTTHLAGVLRRRLHAHALRPPRASVAKSAEAWAWARSTWAGPGSGEALRVTEEGAGQHLFRSDIAPDKTGRAVDGVAHRTAASHAGGTGYVLDRRAPARRASTPTRGSPKRGAVVGGRKQVCRTVFPIVRGRAARTPLT